MCPLKRSLKQAKAYAAAKQPVVIFGTGISASEDASLQALNLALLKNAGVMPLMLEANALGVMQMGCLSDLGPGFAEIKKTGKSYSDDEVRNESALCCRQCAGYRFQGGLLIVQASHANALTEKADLVLPMTALYEKQGTIVNTYGQQKAFAQAQPAAGEAKDGVEIAAEISAADKQDQGVQGKGCCFAGKEGEGRQDRRRGVQTGQGGNGKTLWHIHGHAADGNEPGPALQVRQCSRSWRSSSRCMQK